MPPKIRLSGDNCKNLDSFFLLMTKKDYGTLLFIYMYRRFTSPSVFFLLMPSALARRRAWCRAVPVVPPAARCSCLALSPLPSAPGAFAVAAGRPPCSAGALIPPPSRARSLQRGLRMRATARRRVWCPSVSVPSPVPRCSGLSAPARKKTQRATARIHIYK